MNRTWLIISLAFPVLEMVGIVQVWAHFGAWTLLALALAAWLGFTLLASERLGFLPRLAQSMLEGGQPIKWLLHAGLRFLAGVLLILPGFISDGIALGLLLYTFVAGGRARPVAPDAPVSQARDGRGPGTIEGEYTRLD